MSKQSSSQPINHFRAGGTQVLIFWIPAAVPTICSCLLGYLVNFILLWAAQTHTRIGVCCQETVSVGLLSPWQFGIKKSRIYFCVCFLDFLIYFFTPKHFVLQLFALVLCSYLFGCQYYWSLFWCQLPFFMRFDSCSVVYLIWSFYSSLRNENEWCSLVFWSVLSYFLVVCHSLMISFVLLKIVKFTCTVSTDFTGKTSWGVHISMCVYAYNYDAYCQGPIKILQMYLNTCTFWDVDF